MASAKQLPEMIGEFIELAKQYLREQTLEPARRLGRLAAFSFAGSVLFVLAGLFLAVAVTRFIVGVMPDGSVWSGFGYMLASLALLAATGLVMWRAAR